MISLIVPTLGTREKELHRLFESLNNQTLQDFEVIVVTQDNHQVVEGILSEFPFSYKHAKMNEKGLSKARNEGLKYVEGSILTFSDDDCWYAENCFEEVRSSFEQQNADILCFQIYDPIQNCYYKEYPANQQTKVPIKGLFRKSSIEIFLSLEKIKINDISFDEKFGLGAQYPSGEENIFLFDLYNKGYKSISYLPKKIVFHKKPTMESRINHKTFIGKGPMFKRLFNTPVALGILTLFFVKKVNHLDQPMYTYLNSIKETIKYKK